LKRIRGFVEEELVCAEYGFNGVDTGNSNSLSTSQAVILASVSQWFSQFNAQNYNYLRIFGRAEILRTSHLKRSSQHPSEVDNIKGIVTSPNGKRHEGIGEFGWWDDALAKGTWNLRLG